MDPGPVLNAFVVALLLALVIAGAILAHRQSKKRRKELEALAARLGFRFSAHDPGGVEDRCESLFPTFRQGSRRYVYNVMRGELEGRECLLFDHHYETYSHSKHGRQTHHHHRSFVLVRHDVDLGRIDARPEGILDKVASAFGFDDIDFESAEFSRKWHVKSEDRKLAYEVFHPRMVEYFLGLRGFSVTTQGVHALFRRGSGLMSAAEAEATIADGRRFLELLPRYLRKDRSA